MKKEHVFIGLLKKAPESAAGHTREVLCLAASSKFLASGGKDKRLNIWNIATNSHVRCFGGHRDSITGLVFRRGTQALFSCSQDRTVKTWNLDEMTYVETLFGHQEAVTCIDTISRERCITGGGKDMTMRLWKVVEESQLVFKASSAVHGSLDCVYQVTEEYFVSGDDKGTISLWHINRKKPVFSVHHAHGWLPLTESEKELSIPPKPYWITALAGVKFSDLFFSGSWNGELRCWRLNKERQSIEAVLSLPIVGVINDLRVAEPLDYPSPLDNSLKNTHRSTISDHQLHILVGVGQEHKDGRWWKCSQARNTLQMISFSPLIAMKSK
jgi:ribosomal RNA-processing protein 9